MYRFLVILLLFASLMSGFQSCPVSAVPPANGITFPKFRPVKIDNEMPASRIHAMLEDSRGFLWIATFDGGLLRYDGFSFQTFQHNLEDSTALPEARAYSLFEDRSGLIWIGTANYISCYDWKTDRFKHCQLPDSGTKGLSRNQVNAIVEDSSGVIWLGGPLGLYRLSKNCSTGDYSFESIMPFPNEPYNLFNAVTDMLIDSKDQLWLATYGGLGYINCSDSWKESAPTFQELNVNRQFMRGTFRTLESGADGEIFALANEGVLSIQNNESDRAVHFYPWHEDEERYAKMPLNPEDCLWIADISTKLRIFSLKSRKYCRLSENPEDSEDMALHHATCHSLTRNGDVYLGTAWGGLYSYSPYSQFAEYHPSIKNLIDKDPNNLRFAFQDSRDRLWLGLKKVYLCDRDNGGAIWVRSSNFDENESYKNCIYEDTERRIWLGSEQDGLLYLEPRTKRLIPFNLVRNGTVTALAGDASGGIWAGAMGYNSENRVKSAQLLYIHADRSFVERDTLMSYVEKTLEKDEDILIYHLLPMADGTVWLATGFGLIHFQRNYGALNYYLHDPENDFSLRSNIVKTVYMDPHMPERYLWCGTAGAGLSLLDTKSGKFRHFSKAKGLPGAQVSSILADSAGHLWIGTENGICRAEVSYGDSVTIDFITYDEDDGVEGNNFNYYYGHNAQRADAGELIFASNNGLNIYNPANIQTSEIPLPLYITGLEINYRPISHKDADSPLPAPVSQLRQLTLPYSNNTLTFNFAAIDLKRPKKIRYAYKLDNMNDSWIQCGCRRTAHYTQLDPGKYIFRMKTANGDGVWNESEVSLQLTIKPPWWRSLWAYLAYTLTVLLILCGLAYIFLRRYRLKNELYRSSVEAQKLREADELKSRFFTNISHEFRTPLTLINGLIGRHLRKAVDGNTKRDLTTMQHHLAHLLKMINELLDLSVLEANKMALRASEQDIVLFMKRNVAAFESSASQKGLALRFKTEKSVLFCYFDPDKMRKVMYNLLNNALKFTPRGGSIDVDISVCSGELQKHCRYDDGFACITVRDTGHGIPNVKLPLIFNHFYQVNGEGIEESPGSGIGLSLVKELVELHYGDISVTSKEQEGSSFKIALPLGNKHLKNEKIVTLPVAENVPVMQLPEEERSVEEVTDVEVSDNGGAALVLIIEDNADLRTYIREELAADYQVITTAEGKEGITKAVEHVPDLIISDVMMPGMDGFEVCDKLKSDERTSHIPVILLTAKGDRASRLSGLEIGADDYLIKPFDSKELLVRMQNLILQRRKLRVRYQKQTAMIPSELDVTTLDEAFLQKAQASVEKHMGEEGFSVQLLMREVGMSRTQLHRKLKALTNQSAKEFIQHIRLQRAAELINKGTGNVSDIAFQVGFSDPSYFSRLFKKQFGKSPSNFAEHN